MKKWEEYEYVVVNNIPDQDGNPQLEITLSLKSHADKWDVLSALSDYLEAGLTEEVGA